MWKLHQMSSVPSLDRFQRHVTATNKLWKGIDCNWSRHSRVLEKAILLDELQHDLEDDRISIGIDSPLK
jgi:hypothetical protein